MIRPATPLSVLLVAAFALLLIATLSAPIITGIPLGEFDGMAFGVFGTCVNDDCSPIGIGYEPGAAFEGNDFDLPSSARDTLSSILILHPVAALLALAMAAMAVAAHFRGPSHSSRYLLILFLLIVLTFAISLGAFIIDILLFIPHLAFGSYLVLAATIIMAICGVVSFAMRRTIVGRKTRQQRIAENAEMSGENYYAREGGKPPSPSIAASHPTVPMVSGANSGFNDSLPAFATFENQKKDDAVSDERVPLTHQRSPSEGTPSRMAGEAIPYGPPARSASRDRYGNPINGPPDGHGLAHGSSYERMNARGRGDMGPGGYRGGRGGYGRGGYDNYGAPSRGRGGYGPPPGRGGYGPRGGRGGYGTPPPRGAYGAGGMRGGRTPPPGQHGEPHDMRGPPEAHQAYGAYGQPPSDANGSYGPSSLASASASNVNAGYAAYNPDTSLPRAESPPPVPSNERGGPMGEAIEMEAAPIHGSDNYGQYGQLRDSDADVAGMVGLQQGHGPERHMTYMSDGSKYSNDDQYVPPRAGWKQGSGRSSPRMPSPLHVQNRQQATELPLSGSSPLASPTGNQYYEDVDPRFANAPPPRQPQMSPVAEPVYEDVRAHADGSRSPAGSERSNFTSISQRGVNPRWNPAPPMPNQYPGPGPRRQPRQQDVLQHNPDFQLPGASGGSPKRGGGGAGMIPGSAYPTGGFQ